MKCIKLMYYGKIMAVCSTACFMSKTTQWTSVKVHIGDPHLTNLISVLVDPCFK